MDVAPKAVGVSLKAERGQPEASSGRYPRLTAFLAFRCHASAQRLAGQVLVGARDPLQKKRVIEPILWPPRIPPQDGGFQRAVDGQPRHPPDDRASSVASDDQRAGPLASLVEVSSLEGSRPLFQWIIRCDHGRSNTRRRSRHGRVTILDISLYRTMFNGSFSRSCRITD